MVTEKRTARGLLELRKRYIRRAQHLCRNPEFVAFIREEARPKWEEAFPEFPLSDGSENDPALPVALGRQAAKEQAELSRVQLQDRMGLVLRTTAASRGRMA